ncbi:glycosyl transferase [Bryobacterales bacterium F-183]|nr:glycosyl transferase [Bryobacterales bacterium F-183]
MSLVVAALVAAGMFAIVWFSRRQYQEVLELEPASGEAAKEAQVTVIIPARNEASHIEKCIQSLRQPQVVEILVADDASKDKTAEVAQNAGARVIAGPPRSVGVYGRANACYHASHEVTTKWVLFADADTWYEPGFVAALLERAEADRLDMIMLFPRNRFRWVSEQILTPYAWGIHFTGVSDANIYNLKHPEFLAAGRCMLYRKDAYDFTGGHRAVLRLPFEDAELAKLAKRHRLRFEVMRASRFASVSMDDSLLEIFRKFPRLSFQYLVANTRRRWIVLSASFLFFLYFPVLGWLLYDGQAVAGWLFAMTPAAATYRWYRNPVMPLFSPFAILLFQFLAVYSIAAHYFGFHGWWKGRQL